LDFPGLSDRVLSECSDVLILRSRDLLSVSDVAVCIRVLRDLRACQRWKGRDDAKSERSYGAEKDCPAAGSHGPDGACPPAPAHRPELRAATTRSYFRGSKRSRQPANDRACAPASVAATRRRWLTPSTRAVNGAPSRGGRFHPSTRAPCRPPRPPRADVLRGGVTVLPVGVATRRWAAASAVAATAAISPPDTPPATATWLYVPAGMLTAMEPAGVPGVDASPSALPPGRPGCCTHVPGNSTFSSGAICLFSESTAKRSRGCFPGANIAQCVQIKTHSSSQMIHRNDALSSSGPSGRSSMTH